LVFQLLNPIILKPRSTVSIQLIFSQSIRLASFEVSWQ
jgi:cobyric acid synthase